MEKVYKKTISSRIIKSYLTIIIVSLIFIGLLFGILVKYYLEWRAENTLVNDAYAIQEAYRKETIAQPNTADPKVRQNLRNRLIRDLGNLESDFALITSDLTVLYPRAEEAAKFKTDILPAIKNKLNNGNKPIKVKIQLNNNMEYMAVLLPPRANSTASAKWWVVLYTPVGPVQNLTKGIFLVLIISLIFTGIMAIISGVLFAKSIARPIILLKDRAEALSKRDFDSRVVINTGDELEELASTINKMAGELKEYDIAQKKFLQNASHELKTPLMSIQGYAEGVKDGVFENNSQALDIIVEESNRLKGIVEELIFLSKLETMDDFYKFSKESINEIIEKSVEKVKSLALKNDINIKLMLYKDMTLNLDRDKFTQALINILGNCIRYARHEINITTSNDSRILNIKISDDGEGFDQNEMSNVFERFYKGKKGNTGLGMAITKVIIEKHKGSIEAANASKGGAEFIIRFPIA
jgi:two-component system, OmpR family, sensor histidine kinase CssS